MPEITTLKKGGVLRSLNIKHRSFRCRTAEGPIVRTLRDFLAFCRHLAQRVFVMLLSRYHTFLMRYFPERYEAMVASARSDDNIQVLRRTIAVAEEDLETLRRMHADETRPEVRAELADKIAEQESILRILNHFLSGTW